MEKSTRNYGVDLLRILCIFGVVVLHVQGHGRVLETTVSPLGFSLAWLLEIIAYPAVNCFILISGFVGYRAEKYYPKLSNLLYLFITALFYSVTICLILKHFYPLAISEKDTFEAFFPVTKSQYWFFTSYFAMFLISPTLNLFVHKARDKMLFIFILAFVFLSVFSLKGDPFVLNKGYSFIWFSLIYIIGAIIKKYDIPRKISLLWSVSFIVVAIFTTWITKIVLHFNAMPSSKDENLFISYCSPTIIIMAICLLCIFSKLKISKVHGLISFFASSAFSVYLIHDNLYIRNILMSGRFAFINEQSAFLLPLLVLCCAAGIFLVCTLIDKIRILLFDLCRVKKLCCSVESLIKKAVNFLYKRMSLV